MNPKSGHRGGGGGRGRGAPLAVAACDGVLPSLFLFLVTLDTDSRRLLSLKSSDTNVYEPGGHPTASQGVVEPKLKVKYPPGTRQIFVNFEIGR